MSKMQPSHWQLLTALANGMPQHVFVLSQQAGVKAQQINALWQQMPPHIRGLLRQQDGQWRLVRPLALINESSINYLGEKHDFAISVEKECTSSNDLLLEKARQSFQNIHCSLIVTYVQSQGRGRQGKAWQNRLGECLMFSFAWVFDKPQHELSALSLLVALACHRALAHFGLPVQIKWPNDLVVENNKLGGILIETVRHGGKTTVVVGIGINYVLPKEVDQATSVQTLLHQQEKKTLEVSQLLDALLYQISLLLPKFEQHGFAPFLSSYQQANRDQGCSVMLLQHGQVAHIGKVLGVTPTGALRLQTEEGECLIVSGEISLRPDDGSSAQVKTPKKHYLLLDAGNSQLKWAWIENGNIISVARAPYRDLSQLGAEWNQRANNIDRIVGCAVCGEAKKALVAAQLPQAIEWLASMQQALGIRNHYRNVSEHGSDRWFNALGSRRFTQNACVVVSCGTAVTIDALSDDNHYLGGTIMPGFHLMKEAMAQKTANLNRPLGRVYDFPTTTANALASGLINAVCGSILLMHNRLQRKVGADKKVDIVITGGGAVKVAQSLPMSFNLDNGIQIVDNLVIHGLLNWTEQA